MIIALEGHHRSGKTTLSKALEEYGFIRVREYLSKYRVLRADRQLDDCSVFKEILDNNVYQYELYKDCYVVFDRSIYDIYIAAFICCKPAAFEEFNRYFNRTTKKIRYDYLIWLEELHPPQSGIEYTFNTLCRWKIKPICNVILPATTVEDRIKQLIGIICKE
ncbi:hypothetical protein ACPB8Q_05045 [Methanocaldococcus indicus]|uniref:hypothetical protein n=1 Tax=Methanocaldococcus indicus TaxID=213231 RepID=UPI003C6D15DE